MCFDFFFIGLGKFIVFKFVPPKASQLLPRGWVFQRTMDKTVNFLNKQGVFLATVEKAMAYFSTCGEYSQEELQRFRRLQ